MLRATLHEPSPLQLVLADDRPDRYVEVHVYRDNTVVTILSVPHIDHGYYSAMYTPTQEGYLTAVYRVYEDSYFEVPTDYEVATDVIEVCSDKTNILRLLGMLHENAVFDQQVYNLVGKLTGGRLRCFTSKAAADAQDTGGLVFAYQITAEYSNNQLSSYKITREQ